jgi:UDP-N-acetylglucosamine:LPS N-acetylglucosamine transferase
MTRELAVILEDNPDRTLPMLISGALRGQEEGNTEWVAGTGAAAVTPTPEQLVVTLKHLVRNGTESLLRMRQKAHEAARPEAALHAARGIDRLAARAR